MVYNVEGKRLVIYFFYDREGVVDRYVDYMLQEVSSNTDDLIVVCNGKLADDGKSTFKKYTDKIIVRENIGFDVWAYKTAIESVGYDEISKYEEIVMMNFTIMGPLYPFSEMFDKMNKKDLDFWGITLYHGSDKDPIGNIKYGYLPTHIQSHFIAVRNRMLRSEEFISYWKNMCEINSYQDAVGLHEAIFTKTFEDYGYSWEAYVDTSDELDRAYCPIIMYPRQIIEEKRCPVFKRRSFFHNYRELLTFTAGDVAPDLLEYIEENFEYDIDMVYENVLRLENPSSLNQNMHFMSIIDEKTYSQSQVTAKCAFFYVIKHADQIHFLKKSIENIPHDYDIYIVADKTYRNELCKYFEKITQSRVEYAECNKDDDCYDIINRYVLSYKSICVINDKWYEKYDFRIKYENFVKVLCYNLFHSEKYIKILCKRLEDSRFLGAMSMLMPMFDIAFPKGYDISLDEECIDEINDILKKLEIPYIVKSDCLPLDMSGEVFLVKSSVFSEISKCVKQLDENDRKYLEYIIPYLVYSKGYYVENILNKEYAITHLSNVMFSNNIGSYALEEWAKCADDLKDASKQWRKCKEDLEAAVDSNTVLDERLKEANQQWTICAENWKEAAKNNEQLYSELTECRRELETANLEIARLNNTFFRRVKNHFFHRKGN